MKKFVSLLMALLFVLGIFSISAADEAVPELPGFNGLVTDTAEGGITVVNANGNSLTFKVDDPNVVIPEIGSMVDIRYSGDLATAVIASAITVTQPAVIKTVSGTVTAAEAGYITVKPARGSAVTVTLINSTVITGKADSYKVGDTVTVTYAECVQFTAVVDLGLQIEVTAVKAEKKEEDDTNKKLSGVVTSWNGERITIRTSKGKKWTFKVNSRTKYPSKKELEEGCTVSITYDGDAAKRPYAKKINVTKTAYETEHKTHKKSGTVTSYAEGIGMVFANGTYFDISGAKNSGNKKHRGEGYKATVYYIIDNDTNYATKIKWK